MKNESITELRSAVDYLKEKKSEVQLKNNLLLNELNQYSEKIHKLLSEKNKLSKVKGGFVGKLKIYDLEDNFKTIIWFSVNNEKDSQKARKLITRTLTNMNDRERLIRIDLQKLEKEINIINKKIEGVENKLSTSIIGKSLHTKKTPRLNLPAGERERLRERIIEEVDEFLDSGSLFKEKAFEMLSNDSIRKLGINLTSGQIKGIYQRGKRKNNFRR